VKKVFGILYAVLAVTLIVLCGLFVHYGVEVTSSFDGLFCRVSHFYSNIINGAANAAAIASAGNATDINAEQYANSVDGNLQHGQS
jgi:hypothetical protein